MYRWSLQSGIAQNNRSGVRASMIVYPNPTRGQTLIIYQLRAAALVRIAIYNIQGSLVKTIIHENQATGSHQAVWFGCDEYSKDVSAGVYFLECIIGNAKSTTKLLVIR